MESIIQFVQWLFEQLFLGIFPEGSLDQSIVTTVWVGVIVVAFFNQRLGWTFSGLVIPGYIAPLAIAKPMAAGIIIVESLITYAIVHFYSEVLSRLKIWSSLFGRDRFFALILVSIIVRLIFDGWLLPATSVFIEQHYQTSFDYQSNLHSLGLIIIALTANLFWHKGIIRGIVPLATTVFVTILIIRYILMEYTNFNIGSLEYMYTDFALSLDASPKAYIIIIVSAIVSSRMNLLYGWDFNGILIPALLTLYWYEPIAILFTLIEMSIVLLTATAILKLPFMANKTIEKSKKVVLFFHITFAYRFILGYVFLWSEIGTGRANDLFGIGYLVSTLMAVKIHEKQIFWRLVRANLQTSITAAALANVVGFFFILVPWNYFINKPLNKSVKEIHVTKMSARVFLEKELLNTYKNKVYSTYQRPNLGELYNFKKGIRNICEYLGSRQQQNLLQANIYLQNSGYQLYKTPNYIYLKEHKHNGRGIYIFSLVTNKKLLLSIPFPIEEKTFLPAIHLFSQTQARIVAISNTSISELNATTASKTFFHYFHSVLESYKHDIVQIRSNIRSKNSLAASLWINNNIPRDLDLQALQKSLGRLDVQLQPLPEGNIQRSDSQNNFIELVLGETSLYELLSQNNNIYSKKTVNEHITEHKEKIAPRNSNLYQPPKIEELLFFDELVFTPLVKLQRQFPSKLNIQVLIKKIKLINIYAGYVGYKTILVKDDKNYYLIVQENTKTYKKYQGLYILRLTEYTPYFIQAPRPLFEKYTFEFASQLFFDKKAMALAVSGAHIFSSNTNTSDLLHRDNKVNMLNLFYQVILRENFTKPVLAIQIRAFSLKENRAYPASDVLMSSSQLKTNSRLSFLANTLFRSLINQNLSVTIVSGDQQTSPYSVYNFFQARYLKQLSKKELVVLWLSPYIRDEYNQSKLNFKARQINALNIKKIQDLSKFMQNRTLKDSSSKKIIKDLQLYTSYQDIIILYQLMKKSSYQFYYYVDPESQKIIILACQTLLHMPVIINISVAPTHRTKFATYMKYNKKMIQKFIKSRYTFLIPR
ncbi:poly-gamma-glutamate biosynthesis protein PgsC/CapC [Candidatus Uabimicrobium sp. HlEnr_7]|uniref:poly-gamma-glutamate biosynthesis protein PgsC/CapC n=1 Tax=Candidatus Uabimicrobium helgolandensis TaxID=3095367 RepID=UPI00355770E8